MNEGLLDKIFSVAGGIWTLVFLGASSAIVAWFRSRPGVLERVNERKRDMAEERAGDFERLRGEVARLSARLEVLEKKVGECEAERERERKRANEAEAEVIRLKAYSEGKGEAYQEAQAYLSAERSQDAKKREGGE